MYRRKPVFLWNILHEHVIIKICFFSKNIPILCLSTMFKFCDACTFRKDTLTNTHTQFCLSLNPHADLNIDRGVTVTYLSSRNLPVLQHRWIAHCPDQNKQDFQHGLWIDFRKNISCDSEYFVHGKKTFYLKWRVYTHEIKNALMMIIYMYLILTKWTQITD